MELVKTKKRENGNNGQVELKDLKLCLFKVTLIFGSKLLANRPALPVIIGIKSKIIDEFKNAKTQDDINKLSESYLSDSREEIDSIDKILSMYIVQKACTALDIHNDNIQLDAFVEVIK